MKLVLANLAYESRFNSLRPSVPPNTRVQATRSADAPRAPDADRWAATMS